MSGDAELALLFVDEPAIAELNQRFMGHEGPTDVLAFPIDDDDDVLIGRSPDGSSSGPDRGPSDDVPLLLGDVVVCPAVAARNVPAMPAPTTTSWRCSSSTASSTSSATTTPSPTRPP
ncbi:MAG: rRNA maturation RNase YbeY [Acidimicrobiales bacterium]